MFPTPLGVALNTLKQEKKQKTIDSVFVDICHQFQGKTYGNQYDDITVSNEMLVSLSSLHSKNPDTDPHLDEVTDRNDIDVVDKVIDHQEAQNFNRACVDSGAKATVFEMPQERL